MCRVSFTANIQRHVECPDIEVDATTVAEALERVFAMTPEARSYVLEDNGALRQHMVIFVDGSAVRDRVKLSDAVADDSQVYVMQALSGG